MPKQKNSVQDVKKGQLWNAENIALLGTMPDEELAANLGVKGASVWEARVKRQIDAFGTKKSSIPVAPPAPPKRNGKILVWDEASLAALGVFSDLALSLAWGIGKSTIRVKRATLGIAPIIAKTEFAWSPENQALVGTMSDRELARRLKITDTIARNKRIRMGIGANPNRPRKNVFTSEAIEKLGKISDKELAADLGVSVTTVSLKRRELGIPISTKKVLWTPSTLALLGQMPDLKLAEKLGTYYLAVRKKRESLAIPRYTSGLVNIQGYPLFASISECSQNDFYLKLASEYQSRVGERLTYPKLSELCKWSVSRLQKWFTPGTAQEPLSVPVRHHIYLSVKDAIITF